MCPETRGYIPPEHTEHKKTHSPEQPHPELVVHQTKSQKWWDTTQRFGRAVSGEARQLGQRVQSGILGKQHEQGLRAAQEVKAETKEVARKVIKGTQRKTEQYIAQMKSYISERGHHFDEAMQAAETALKVIEARAEKWNLFEEVEKWLQDKRREIELEKATHVNITGGDSSTIRKAA